MAWQGTGVTLIEGRGGEGTPIPGYTVQYSTGDTYPRLYTTLQCLSQVTWTVTQLWLVK